MEKRYIGKVCADNLDACRIAPVLRKEFSGIRKMFGKNQNAGCVRVNVVPRDIISSKHGQNHGKPKQCFWKKGTKIAGLA